VAASHELDFNTAVTMPTASCLSRRTIEFIPGLKGAHFIRTWAGLRPHCYIDDLPIIGKAVSPSGFVIATGHLGMGVANAPITGKLIAELIIDNKTSLPIDAFSFSRFKN
jgi:sarcosine oxidase subunit beta